MSHHSARRALAGVLALTALSLLLSAPLEAQRRTYDRFADSAKWQGAEKGVGGTLDDTGWRLRGMGWAAGDASRPEAVTLRAVRSRNYANLSLSLQPDASSAPETVDLFLVIDSVRIRIASAPRLTAAREVISAPIGTQVRDFYEFPIDTSVASRLLRAASIEGRIEGREFRWTESDRSYRELKALLTAKAGAP